jgi:hypothetical protein
MRLTQGRCAFLPMQLFPGDRVQPCLRGHTVLRRDAAACADRTSQLAADDNRKAAFGRNRVALNQDGASAPGNAVTTSAIGLSCTMMAAEFPPQSAAWRVPRASKFATISESVRPRYRQLRERRENKGGRAPEAGTGCPVSDRVPLVSLRARPPKQSTAEIAPLPRASAPGREVIE